MALAFRLIARALIRHGRTGQGCRQRHHYGGLDDDVLVACTWLPSESVTVITKVSVASGSPGVSVGAANSALRAVALDKVTVGPAVCAMA